MMDDMKRVDEAKNLKDVSVSMPHDKGYKKSLCGNREAVVKKIQN